MRSRSFVLSSNLGMASKAPTLRFLRNEGGGASVQAAMIFGAAGMALALVGAPLMQGAGERFASGATVDR